MARLEVCDVSPSSEGDESDLRELSLATHTANGMMTGGFAESEWKEIFQLLEKGGRISLEEAVKFFGRIESRRDNYKRQKANPYPRRQYLIIFHWVSFNLPNEKLPDLCSLTNARAVEVLAKLEGRDENAADSESNFSREKRELRLLSCAERRGKDAKGKMR